jgi:hypothetical protein
MKYVCSLYVWSMYAYETFHILFCSRRGRSPTPIRRSPGGLHHDTRLVDTVSNVVEIVKHDHDHGHNRRRIIGKESLLTELYHIIRVWNHSFSLVIDFQTFKSYELITYIVSCSIIWFVSKLLPYDREHKALDHLLVT